MAVPAFFMCDTRNTRNAIVLWGSIYREESCKRKNKSICHRHDQKPSLRNKCREEDTHSAILFVSDIVREIDDESRVSLRVEISTVLATITKHILSRQEISSNMVSN